MFLPASVNERNIGQEKRMQALSSISPRFYTNEELHVIYPSILKGPAHLPLDYLINNEMTQFLYGTCIVAILQDFYNTENVDD